MIKNLIKGKTRCTKKRRRIPFLVLLGWSIFVLFFINHSLLATASEKLPKSQKLGFDRMPLNVYRGEEVPEVSDQLPHRSPEQILKNSDSANVDYVVGRRIEYGSWFTNVFYINDNLAYCLNPELLAPTTGSYQTEILRSNEALMKGLYYLFGGPGWETYVNRFGYLEDGSFDKEYCSTHVILSYLSNPAGEAFRGLDTYWIEVLKYQAECVKSLPAPPDAEIAFAKKHLKTEYDVKTGIQKTEVQTLLADSRNTVTLVLPQGISLVHTEDGKKETGKVLLMGGESFYLLGSAEDTNGLRWDSGKLIGSITNEWQGLVIRSGEGAQDIGSWAWQQEAPAGAGFQTEFDSIGRIRIRKESSRPEDTVGNPYYNLTGAVFIIENEEGESVAEVRTDAAGGACSDWLPWGQYRVMESESPKGYLPALGYEITLDSQEVQQIVKEQPQYGQIVLQKVDAETLQPSPQRPSSLSGAEYELLDAQGNRLEILKTDDSGEVRSGKLVLGKYIIREIKAPKGYLCDQTEYTVELTSQDPNTEVFIQRILSKEKIIRGDLELIKVEEGTMKRLTGIPFRITSKTTGENHVIITDQNGYASTASSWNLHTDHTNRGEADSDGIWFGEGTPDDTCGAMPYDTYEIEELACEANQKYELIPTFEITVSQDSQMINLGTLTNDIPIIPEISIKTQARDRDGEGKEIPNKVKAGIIDLISYQNLMVGREYLLAGILMDRKTGKPLLIEGKPVFTEKVFTASEPNGEVEVEFEFDAGSLWEREIVVFEILYEEGIQITSHEDLDAAEQTVRVAPRESPDDQQKGVQTGDVSNKQIIIWTSIAGLSFFLFFAIMMVIKKNQKSF